MQQAKLWLSSIVDMGKLQSDLKHWNPSHEWQEREHNYRAIMEHPTKPIIIITNHLFWTTLGKDKLQRQEEVWGRYYRVVGATLNQHLTIVGTFTFLSSEAS